MGLYDIIRFDFDPPLLPDWAKGEEWQTKDTEPQRLVTHTITADGQLLWNGETPADDWNTTIEFYTSNVCGWSRDGYLLRKGTGDHPVSITITADFLGGVMQKYTMQIEATVGEQVLTQEQFHQALQRGRKILEDMEQGRIPGWLS